MPVIPILTTDPTPAVDVSSWICDTSYEGIYPVGARPKKVIYCPQNCVAKSIVKGKKYLFKKSFERYPDQFWMERVAYIVGCFVGAVVPSTFIGYDSSTNECGALIEWFYDDNDPMFFSYIDGSAIFVSLIDGFDIKTGKQHNLESINAIAMSLIKSKDLLIEVDFYSYFIKMLIFDSLIGNTDRHQENWGLILYGTSSSNKIVRYSPAFDNGTSLGHEILPVKFNNFNNPMRLAQYIAKGTHHIKWKQDSNAGIGHIELIKAISSNSRFRILALNMLSFKESDLSNEILSLSLVDTPVPFSHERATFTNKLIMARRNALLKELGDHR